MRANASLRCVKLTERRCRVDNLRPCAKRLCNALSDTSTVKGEVYEGVQVEVHESTGLVFGERARPSAGRRHLNTITWGDDAALPVQRRPSFALLDAATGRCCRRRGGNSAGMHSVGARSSGWKKHKPLHTYENADPIGLPVPRPPTNQGGFAPPDPPGLGGRPSLVPPCGVLSVAQTLSN